MSTTTPSQIITLTESTTTRTATVATCTWEGHCLGDPCASEDDCDRDWVCATGATRTCTLCCVTESTPTSTSALTSTTAAASSGGLKTGAAVGIGVGGGILVIICVVGGLWIFMRRKKNKREAYELGSVPPSYHDADRKELYQENAADRQELETRNPPVELSAVPMAELDDNDIATRAEREREREMEMERERESEKITD